MMNQIVIDKSLSLSELQSRLDYWHFKQKCNEIANDSYFISEQRKLDDAYIYAYEQAIREKQ